MLFKEENDLISDNYIFKGEKAEPREIKAHKDRIYDLNFNMDGTKIATASDDSKINIWEMGSNNERVNTYREHEELVERAVWHPSDKNILVSVSEDQTTKLWDIRTEKSIFTHKSNHKTKESNSYVCWNPNGKSFALSKIIKLCLFSRFKGINY